MFRYSFTLIFVHRKIIYLTGGDVQNHSPPTKYLAAACLAFPSPVLICTLHLPLINVALYGKRRTWVNEAQVANWDDRPSQVFVMAALILLL